MSPAPHSIVHHHREPHQGTIFVSRYAATPACASAPTARPPRANPSTFHVHDFSVIATTSGDGVVVEHLHGATSTRWRLGPGDLLLVPSGLPHRLRSASGDGVGVGFCPACLDLDEPHLLAPFLHVRAGASPVLSLAPERRATFEGYVRELERATTTPTTPPLVTRSLLVLLLHELAGARDAPPAPTASVVADALRFIEANCLTPLTLAEVAAHVRRSPTHLASVIKKATGRTTLDWIVSHRMTQARARLRHTDEHVDVIAERVGYADATHFIRTFRRHHGETPAAWRRRHLG